MQSDENRELAGELAFMEAMRAYRAARDSGDAEATAAAEEAWREMVRGELVNRTGEQG